MRAEGCQGLAVIAVTVLGMAGLSAGRPCLAEGSLPGATQPVHKISGDVHIRDRVAWRGCCYQVAGNIILHAGGTLAIENARVELTGEYSRHYNWRWDGGQLITRHATIGGSLREGRGRQANIELTDGDWEATDTAVQCCYGITFGNGPKVGRLRARWLIAGPFPDTIIMTGRGDAVVEDSEYDVSLTANANAGAAEVVLREAAIGRCTAGDPVHGQITAQGRGRVTVQHARVADLVLVTRDQGTITHENCQLEGGIETRPEGGPITLPGGG